MSLLQRMVQMSLYINNLTHKQKKVYSIIEAYIKTNGIPPTVREIGELAGEKTPGAVQGILNRLEQKGAIKRQLGMARSIKLISEESMLYTDPVYIPQVKKINKRNISNLLNIYNIKKYHPISPEFIDADRQYFLLPCPDDSLIESGIRQKDMLLICTDCDINNGDVVIVYLEGLVLLRIYYKNASGDTITLKANTNLLDKEEFDKNDVEIIGRLAYRFQRY